MAAEIRRRLGPVPSCSDWPAISIVVLNRDGADRLRNLLAGLHECTDYQGLELILVDNGSTDDSLDFMRRVTAPFPITIVANANNESFSDGCNRGAALASGELLLFLNNDVEPAEPGWLRELVVCLRRRAAAAVGPTLIGPYRGSAGIDYRIEQRGQWIGVADGVLVPVERDRGEDPLGARLGEDTEVATLVAACLLIERELFESVGGFTHGFWYGGEDSDLSLKLRERGMKVVSSGRSLLVHRTNSTLDAIDRRQRGAWVRGNRRLFMERWGPRVRREYELDRLAGGNLWAQPQPPGVSSWGATPAAVEALGFCLKWSGDAPEPPLDQLVAALRARGRRATVLRGSEAGGLAAFDYDVVVHCGGPWRELPSHSQLNLCWPAGRAASLGPVVRRRYDLVFDGQAEASLDADRLIAVADELAHERGFNRRITPSPS